MEIFDYMERHDYEQLVLCQDRVVGLKAIIAIHDTTLGPALGGIRMRTYASEGEAIEDALRLGQAMTYKAAVAGLNLGGGKAVLIGDPLRDKKEVLFRSLARFIQSLGGRYIATEDVGTTVRDMEYVSRETGHVTGLPLAKGGSGDPSPPTALGVLQAMKACAEEVLGGDSLHRRIVAIQGLGKVGQNLLPLLRKEGARIVASDINEKAVQRAQQLGAITIVEPRDIYDVECDIFSPCAFGGVINDDTIPRLKARIVCGSANNQLQEGRHGDALAQRGILYAPDFVASAGGLINLSFELTGYDAELARRAVMEIYALMKQVIALAKERGISTAVAANSIAETRLQEVRKLKSIYL